MAILRFELSEQSIHFFLREGGEMSQVMRIKR